jgi:homoserine dehydrogenase
MTNQLRIGVAGLGTVGTGVLRLLAAHGDLIAERAGRPVRVTAVSARDRAKDRGLDLSAAQWFEDAIRLADAPDVDLVLELIGGAEGIARELVERALAAGKPVITANKALMAHHGSQLARKAEEAGVALAYEAAVAGGVPVIKALREGLAANKALMAHSATLRGDWRLSVLTSGCERL